MIPFLSLRPPSSSLLLFYSFVFRHGPPLYYFHFHYVPVLLTFKNQQAERLEAFPRTETLPQDPVQLSQIMVALLLLFFPCTIFWAITGTFDISITNETRGRKCLFKLFMNHIPSFFATSLPFVCATSSTSMLQTKISSSHKSRVLVGLRTSSNTTVD